MKNFQKPREVIINMIDKKVIYNDKDFSKHLKGLDLSEEDIKYILGETDMNSSLYLGASGAVGVYAAKLVAPMIPFESYLPDGSYTDGTTLELRLLEVAGSVGVSFAVNKFILKMILLSMFK